MSTSAAPSRLETLVSARHRWALGSGTTDIVHMPLLAHAAAQYAGALEGVSVLYVNHAISDSLMVARALHSVGARLVNVLVPYRGVQQSNADTHLSRAFADLGPTYYPTVKHPSHFAEVMRREVATALSHLASSAPGSWMIVEDGGYAFPALHDDPELSRFLGTCLGAVEHTTRGRWNYEFRETDAAPSTPRVLRRPAVTIAGSRLKTAHEGGFIAQALLDECHWLLRRDHQFLRHRPVLVTGYGRVGRVLARELTQIDAQVMVHDPCLETGVGPGMKETDVAAALASGVFLVFGATGTSSVSVTDLRVFLQDSHESTLYLASASSKALEFAEIITALHCGAGDPQMAAALAGTSARIDAIVEEVGLRYKITGPQLRGGEKHVVLLGEGYPVIFYPANTHGAPNRAMDPVMTQLFLAAAGLPAGARRLDLVTHDVDALRCQSSLPAAWQALVDEEALLRAWCEANSIDWPTYRAHVEFGDLAVDQAGSSWRS